MALDAEYFDSIYIDVVKKKYYNANKVHAVFADIRRQAEELNAENAMLRQELEGLRDRRVEIGDALLSAQAIYQEIIDKAKARAEAIVAEAERESQQIRRQNQHQQDYAVQRVEAAFNRMRQQHLAAIEDINREWQSFLCDLYPEQEAETEAQPTEHPSAPADLEEKVGAIAERLFSIEGEK